MVVKNGQLDPDFDTDQMKWTKSILKDLAVPADTLEHLRQLAWLTDQPQSEFVDYKINMRVKPKTGSDADRQTRSTQVQPTELAVSDRDLRQTPQAKEATRNRRNDSRHRRMPEWWAAICWTFSHRCELYRTDLQGIDRRPGAGLPRSRPAVMRTSIGALRPDVVLHMAAETDVDRCEREVDHAFRSNALGDAEHRARVPALRHRRWCTSARPASSTARKTEPYTEFDSPSPVNVYAQVEVGRRKVRPGVRAEALHRPRRVDVRRQGEGQEVRRQDRRAVPVSRDAEIKAVDDKFGCPTYAVDLLAGASGCLIRIRRLRRVSRRERRVVQPLRRGRRDQPFAGQRARVIPVSSANFPLSAPRPRSEASRAYKFELLGLGRMRTWREALADYLSTWDEPDTFPAVAAPAGTGSTRTPNVMQTEYRVAAGHS